MSIPVSVIIITKNESSRIEDCVKNALYLTTDVIVVDTYSTDNTAKIAEKAGAKVLLHTWIGYGSNRNIGAEAAKYDWIFSLDADERFSPELIQQIGSVDWQQIDRIYACHRLTFIGNKPITHGDWGHDVVTRLYNRKATRWNTAAVHEQIIADGMEKKLLQGSLWHYSFQDIQQLFDKARYYSRLNAQKYLGMPSKRKNTTLKMLFSPIMAFIKTYVLRAGFLDGKEGLAIAHAAAYSAYVKYKLLRNLKSLPS